MQQNNIEHTVTVKSLDTHCKEHVHHINIFWFHVTTVFLHKVFFFVHVIGSKLQSSFKVLL